MKRTERDKAEAKRLRKLSVHLSNEITMRAADKLMAGEELNEEETLRARMMPKVMKKLARFEVTGSVFKKAAKVPVIKRTRGEVVPQISAQRQEFYTSPEWRRLRYRALVLHGGKCQACGRASKDGIVIHVDHVKPISKFPGLKLEITNLQVLCDDCNMGKGAWDQTDWRALQLVVDNVSKAQAS